MNTFNYDTYQEQINVFPHITYAEYEKITNLRVRKEIIKKNKILKTDAYNRTMTEIRWEKWMLPETFTLSFRKNAGKTFNVVYGIKDKLVELFGTPITQSELDFATDFYAAQKKIWGNSSFNKAMWQDIIDNHEWYIPLDIKAVADGTPLKAWEPVMTVNGPGELAAIYEPMFMGCTFKSMVATDWLVITNIMHQWRIVIWDDNEEIKVANIIKWIYADEFGLRSTYNLDHHFDAAEALIVWAGLQATSSDATAAVYPQLRTSWTIAHRFLASYETEEEAFEEAIQKKDKITLLVDLVDSYQGIEKVITLKKKYRDTWKKIWIRLDSGDLCDQTLYALRRFKEEWLTDPSLDKIVVADISSIDDIVKIETAVRDMGIDPRDYIYYGLGELLVNKNKTRSRASTGFKVTRTNGRNTGKLSNDPGKIPLPWKLNIDVRENERVIVQDEESIQGKRLLNTVYKNGTLAYDTNDIEYVNNARQCLIKNLDDIYKPTVQSEKTKATVVEVKTWFEWQKKSTNKAA
jgi:nicotinic acid phosphoribosyltransferase